MYQLNITLELPVNCNHCHAPLNTRVIEHGMTPVYSTVHGSGGWAVHRKCVSEFARARAAFFDGMEKRAEAK